MNIEGQTIASLVEAWDGLGVITRYDADSATWIFIALHDDTLGGPVGGTRLRSYASPADGLRDAMRLAEGMTHKWAALGLDWGGGKAVLAVPGALDAETRRKLLSRYAALLNTLRGTFSTGRDLGTTDADMLALSEITEHVHGVDRSTGAVRDPGPYTAKGVYAVVRAALLRLYDSDDFSGRTIQVQGVGGVGEPLARELVASGAAVMISDIDHPRAEALAREIAATVVSNESAHASPCDVYAPCAVGATLDAGTIPELRCRAVVGSANNQLADANDADRLHRRGILYAPDFMANGGGALAFGLMHRGLKDAGEISRRLAGIGDAVEQVWQEAKQRGESPLRAARRRVDRKLGRS